MIHDYGGKEEFLSNHANFLATDNSVYLIVVPLVQVGESMQDIRVRSITEMLERYLFWCRFVFSVVRREQAFPVIETFKDGIRRVRPAGSALERGIPMVTLINRFKQFCSEKHHETHIENTIPVLTRQLKHEFSLSSDIEDASSDFLVTKKCF